MPFWNRVEFTATFSMSVRLPQILALQSREWKIIPSGPFPSPEARLLPAGRIRKVSSKLALICCFTFFSAAQRWFPAPSSFPPKTDILTPLHFGDKN